MTQFNRYEVFARHDAVIGDVNVKKGLIDLIAVPWDQFADVPWRGEMWREVFRRGAFDGLENHVDRVRVNREHVKGDTVGKLVFADPKSEAGLVVRAQTFSTERGRETAILADEDGVSPSVGYRINKLEDLRLERRTHLREVLRAILDHLSLVESPAFAGAQVLAVHSEQSPQVDEEPPSFTKALNEAYAEPAYLRALERLNQRDQIA